MATIKDVAKHAGVSTATVSRVLNGTAKVSDETHRRVQQSINTLGFEPDFLARSWRTRVTHTIAAVVSDNTSPHHGVALREASTVALAHNYTLILCTTFSDPKIEKQYLRMLRERRIDGVLLNTVGKCDDEIRALTESGIPVVLLNRPLRDYGPLVDAVVVDSYRGSRTLVEHLIGVGHRRIAVVYSEALNDFHKRARLRGYRDALRAHGLPYEENLVRATKLGRRDGREFVTQQLVFSPRPTVLYAAGYSTGLATIATLQAQGLRIPADIAFAMFDDVTWGEFVDPPLTVVRNPAQELGRQAMELLFARLADRSRPPQEIVLAPSVVVRRSCGWPGLAAAALAKSAETQDSLILGASSENEEEETGWRKVL
ncbi:MAG: LacI family transcriptional regulator [Chloroflexi bacterium]|nr:LacI family transcriptional regulator [Chloroflexota bacterium]